MAGSSLRSAARRSRNSFSSLAEGSLPIPQQVAGFFEIGVVSEFVNVDAAVGQDALIPVDVADAGGGGDNSFQTLGGLGGGQAGHVPSLKISQQSGCGRTGKEKRRVLSQLTFIRQKF